MAAFVIAGCVQLLGPHGAEAQQAERRQGLPPESTARIPVVLFDGERLTRARAREIAAAAGHDFVDLSACPAGDGGFRPNCVDLEVDTPNGGRRTFTLLGMPCDGISFVPDRGPRRRLSDQPPRTATNVAPLPGPQCYGGYAAVMRTTMTAALEADGNDVSSHVIVEIDRPLNTGALRWSRVGVVEMGSAMRLRDGFRPRHNWAVTVEDGQGEIVSSETSDGGLGLDADGGRQSTGAPQPPAVSPIQLCAAKRDAVRAQQEVTVSAGHLACSAGSGWTDQLTVTFDTPLLDVEFTGDGVCDTVRELSSSVAEALAQTVHQNCLEEAAAPPPNPPAPPIAPDRPTDPPGGREPLEPICPEVSQVPYMTSYSFTVPGEAGEPSTDFTCFVLVQDNCSVNEETGTCDCVQNVIEEDGCIGLQEFGGRWESE